MNWTLPSGIVKLLFPVLLILTLGSAVSGSEINDRKTEEIIAGMTLQDRVAQLFVITPEALTGVSVVTMAGSVTQNAFANYPVGGLIYSEPNLQSWDQACQMLSSMQEISMDRIALPVFLAVDEEGGKVRRVSGRLQNAPDIPEMLAVGNTQDPLQAYQVGSSIGGYLSRLGFNMDFAPVADVLTNPQNSVIGTRSFGSDAKQVAEMVALEVQGLNEQGVFAVLKHFPGHGNTYEDSHQGAAISNKTLDELRSCEFIPFLKGIDAGAEFVMAGHISMPGITGDDTPASLSRLMLTDILRGELGFDGIIISDALNMGAIANQYSSGDAAVQTFLAGSDLILMPADFQAAYSAVLEAVRSGKITAQRLEESLRRIIGLKIRMQNAASEEMPEALEILEALQTPSDLRDGTDEDQEGFIVEN